MRCPFGFLGSSAPAPAPNGKCPFAGLLAAPAGPDNNMDKPAEPGLGTRPPTNCPAPDKERSGPAAAAASAATPAVCPYGFGSAAQKDDVLAALQCARCRGLYYDAVRTSCGHFFCRACITRDGAQPLCDCLLCGADIASVDAEPQLQGVVDAYIAAAGAAPAAARSAPDAAAAGGAGGAGSGDGGGGDGGRAAFLLDTALRSMAGRNFVAARARLTLCRAALLARLGLGPEEHGGSGGVSGGAASAASCEEQGGRSEGAAALGRAEPGAGDGSGGTGAAAAGQASPTAEGRAAAGGGGEAGSAGKPGAAGRDSGSAAAAGHRESARDPVREGGAGGSADQLACQLGAVCGSLGDCCRALGEPDAAAGAYRESVAHLRRCAAPTRDALRCRALAASKLGDLLYARGALPAALAQYTDALAARRAALAAATAGGGSAAEALALTCQGQGRRAEPAPGAAGAGPGRAAPGGAARLSGGDENGGGSGGGSGGGGGGAELGVPVAEALDHATSLCKVADLEQARARCRGALGGAEPWLPQLGCSGAAREAPRRVKRRALRALALGRQAAADAALAEAAQTLQVAGPAAVAGGSPALVAKARALRDFLAGGA